MLYFIGTIQFIIIYLSKIKYRINLNCKTNLHNIKLNF